MPTLSVNGCDLYCDDRGTGEPLVLLHGGMGIGADWDLVFPSRPMGYRTIVPDLRGHGRSTNPSRAFTFRQCALDVLALLDELGVGTFRAIGLSMGAKTLLHVATLQPDRVPAMVLVSATPYFPAAVRQAMAQFTGAAFEALSEDELSALRARHVHGDAQIRQLYAMTEGFATSYDDMAFTPPLLATIRARTLIVHGDRDSLYPIDMAVQLFQSIPGSSLWVVPGGAHGPIFGERATPFATTALTYLAG